MTAPFWPAVIDADYVEQLLPAIQQAVVSVTPPAGPEGDHYEVSAPDLANALLIALATVLEPSPACSTPQSMRKLAEAAGKELAQLMRDARRIREAEATTPGAIN